MMKVLEEYIDSTPQDGGMRKESLNRTSFDQEIRPNIGKLHLIKAKISCMTIERIK